MSQTQNSISLIENRLKAVEQQNKFEENFEFQTAVDKKLERYMTSRKSEENLSIISMFQNIVHLLYINMLELLLIGPLEKGNSIAK